MFQHASGDVKIRFEYENVPLLCKKCMRLGHVEEDCSPAGNPNPRSYAAATRGPGSSVRRQGRSRGTERARLHVAQEGTNDGSSREGLSSRGLLLYNHLRLSSS